MPTLDDRVAALEAQVRALAGQLGSETLTPNYLTVAADGSVGADFTGRIHAQGLDLDAGAVSTPPDVDRVRWLRTSDGSVVADLFAYDSGAARGVSVETKSAGGGSIPHFAQLAAGGPGVAYIQAQSDPSGTASKVSAVANAASATVVDGAQQSSFLQLATWTESGTPLELRLTLGSVDSAAGAINWQSGSFTVTKNATGDFTISALPSGTIPEPFPLLTDAAAAATPVEFVIVAKTASSFRFQSKSTAGVNTDVPFYFAAIS